MVATDLTLNGHLSRVKYRELVGSAALRRRASKTSRGGLASADDSRDEDRGRTSCLPSAHSRCVAPERSARTQGAGSLVPCQSSPVQLPPSQLLVASPPTLPRGRLYVQ